MTRVDFYVLPTDQAEARLLTACRLAAKAWQHNLRVLIHCADQNQCQTLDELLWGYRPERFIPHGLYSDWPNSPVVLAVADTADTPAQLLINLALRLPAHPQHFKRVIEIIDQHPQRLAIGRENFRQYRRNGYDPQRVEL